MSFNTPLTSPQITKLRSLQYSGQQNVSLFSNRVVFKALTTVDLTNTTSWESLTYGSVTVGAYTDIELGMTVLISLSNDIKAAIFRGRVHSTHLPTNTTLYLNESDAKLPIGAYIFIIDTFEAFDMLSRPVGTAPPVQEVDYDIDYHGDPPSISGLQYVYVDNCDSGTGKLRVTLALTAHAITAGTSATTWLIVPRAGTYTLISGSLSSANAVIDFNPGETWFQVLLTDSAGNVMRRHSGVKAHDADHPPDVAFENIDITGALDRGWTARCPAFHGVADVLPWTLGVVWRSDESYGGVSGALGASNNIDFVGYLRKDDPRSQADRSYGVLSATTFEMVDIANRLMATEMQQLAISQNLAPSLWDQIADLTPWRGIWHMLTQHSTVATLVDITADSFLSGTDFLFPVVTTQGNNLLTACNGIAAQVNAALEFAKDGRVTVPRDARLLDQAGRDGIPTIAAFTEADGFTVISASRNYENNVGVLDANGAVALDGSASANVQPFLARSPGMAQGQSQGQYTLANQILTVGAAANADGELRQRAGNEYELRNLQETLTIEFADGYNFFEPSRAQYFTFAFTATLDGSNGVQRIIYNNQVLWLCTQFSFNHATATGSRKPTGTFQRVSRLGDLAYPVPIPAQPTASILPFSFQFMPAAFPGFNAILLPRAGFSTPPPVPKPKPKITAPVDGNLDITWTSTRAWITRNFAALSAPVWTEVTPSDLGSCAVKHALMDPFTVGTSTPGAYLLASDGTNSAVWHTANVLLASPVWSKGTNETGVYTLLRPTETAGQIGIYSPGAPGSWSKDIDLTASDGFLTLWPNLAPNTPTYTGVYTPATGWQQVNTASDSIRNYTKLYVGRTMPAPFAVTKIKFTFDRTLGANNGGLLVQIEGYLSGAFAIFQSTGPGPTGSAQTYEWNGSATIDSFVFNTNIGSTPDTSTTPTGTATLTAARLEGTGTNPFGGAGSSQARYSTDYGATFGSAIVVGTSPGNAAGFDVIHNGTTTIAAADQSAYAATTFGGAFTVDGLGSTAPAQPLLILVPLAQWANDSVKNYNTATPDYLVGASAPVSSQTLWLVKGGTAAFNVTPTISGVHGIPVGANCCTTWLGSRIAGLFSFSGVTHLMTGVITNSTTPTIAWTDRGIYADSVYARGLYRARKASVLIWGGGGHTNFSPDWGITRSARRPPVSSSLLGIECFG